MEDEADASVGAVVGANLAEPCTERARTSRTAAVGATVARSTGRWLTRAAFRKGSRVMGSGRLVQRTFETEDGSRRTAIEIQVQHLAADVQFAAVEIKKAQVGDSPAPAEQAG